MASTEQLAALASALADNQKGKYAHRTSFVHLFDVSIVVQHHLTLVAALTFLAYDTCITFSQEVCLPTHAL